MSWEVATQAADRAAAAVAAGEDSWGTWAAIAAHEW